MYREDTPFILSSLSSSCEQAASHLVELYHQDQAGPADVIEGQQEDAEQPWGAADQAGDHSPQALILIVQHAVNRPV